MARDTDTLAPIAFVDTETTSLATDRRAWDVGIIRREPDGSETVLNMIVRDINLANADRMALKVGHFFDRHPEYGGNPGSATIQPESVVACRVERMLRNAHIVGAVPSFDQHVLHNMLTRHELPWTAHHHLCDVEQLLVGWFAAKDPTQRALAPPWHTEDLSNMAGIEPPPPATRHTALGDAEWCQEIYDTVLRSG